MRYNINEGIKHYKNRARKLITTLTVTVSSLGLMLGVPLAAHAAGCTAVSTSKGSLTAAQIGGTVSGDLDATGCDIGAYFNNDNPGKVKNAEVHDANQYGVFVDGNVSGSLKLNVVKSKVYNIGHHDGSGNFDPNGSQYGIGIYYYGFGSPGTVSGKIKGNEISQYQKGGIAINGENASAKVKHNKVTGLDPVQFIAQNGIQFGYGASGQVRNNVVDGNTYLGDTWTSTGILVFETSHVNVKKNTVKNNQTAIGLEAWCYFVQGASNNKVVNNTVSGAEYGVTVSAYSLGGYSTCDSQANNNKVANNTIKTEDGDTGIFVGTGTYYGGTDSPQADSNKVIRNCVSGFATDYDHVGDTATKVHANSFQNGGHCRHHGHHHKKHHHRHHGHHRRHHNPFRENHHHKKHHGHNSHHKKHGHHRYHGYRR